MVHCYELPKLNSSQKKNKIKIMLNTQNTTGDHSFITFAKFSEKLRFLIP